MLDAVKYLCNVGSSRSVTIEDYKELGPFFIDGDGPDAITSVKLDGDEWENKKESSVASLKDQLIKLGNANEDLRDHIRPILAEIKKAASDLGEIDRALAGAKSTLKRAGFTEEDGASHYPFYFVKEPKGQSGYGPTFAEGSLYVTVNDSNYMEVTMRGGGDDYHDGRRLSDARDVQEMVKKAVSLGRNL